MPTFLPQNQFLPNPAMPTAGSAVPSDLPPVIGGTAAPFDKPAPNEGRSKESPAGSAPNTAAPAGALETQFDWLSLFITIMDERFVLFDLYDETPLFVREADGYLRRNA